jgi:two-component system invasion response regulator UvrY
MAIQQLNGEQNPVDVLSDREFEVFIALAKGKTTNEIADTLSLSPRTVGTHLYNIKQKLNANNSAELALIAMRCGLIDP